MIRLKDKLVLEEIASQLLFSYYFIDERFDGWERKKGYANWRVEIFDFISTSPIEHSTYVARRLEKEDSKVYIEFQTLLSDYIKEPAEKQPKVSRINRIINYVKEFINPPIKVQKESTRV